jgi:hypothetical protein
MTDTVKITLAAHHDGKLPGDSIEVDAREAKRLVGAGIAVPSTKPAAKALGLDLDSAATAKD